MKYILSQKEFDSFLEKKENIDANTRVILQDLCTKVADHMPVPRSWVSKPAPQPWGCKITEEASGSEWFCDDCPVQNVCPSDDKEWSK